MTNDNTIEELKRNIAAAEQSLEAAKKALFELTGESDTKTQGPGTNSAPIGLRVTSDGKVIEGIFNGENMIGPEGKIFPVPANYASKSKLVAGDKMKLTVAEDGSFIFKQIGPVERKNIVATLNFTDNAYHVLADGHRYNLLYAAVSFHKAKPGDKVTIVVPASGDSEWAALENIIHDVQPAKVDEGVLNLDLPTNSPVQPEPPAPAPVPAPEPTQPSISTDTDELPDLEI